MSQALFTKIGIFIGFTFFIFIYSYAIFDGYIKIKNGQDVISNLALLFAFFAWRKVSKIDFFLKCYLNKKNLEG